MSKKNIITLKMLASKLNLSISTVSRALNDHPDISSKTKDKVNIFARKFNYVPNIFAKGFRTHKSNIVGVIVPNIDHYFTSTLIKGVLNEAERNGYKVIISESDNDEQKQAELMQTMKQFGVDGIILSLVKNTKNVDQIIDIMNQIPVVLFDKVSFKVPCTQVIIDDEDAAFRAVEHLIMTGKKRIAIIKETANSFISEKRFLGYMKALKKYGIEYDEDIVLSSNDISLEEGKKLTRVLISMINKPDAIFAITDEAGIGAIKILNKNKIKIPDEIAVVGFCNSINSTIIKPKLTTIDQPGNRIGETALKYLLDEINNENEINHKTIEIKTNLIVRNSSFKLKKQKSVKEIRLSSKLS